jgi:HAD superfamily hydrolase (TIGR01509 family)
MRDAHVLVLDAMGVLYDHPDDVAELLIPYVRKLGCRMANYEIEGAYKECSLGRITSFEFWKMLGLSGKASDETYCAQHRLTPKSSRVLEAAKIKGLKVCCLSNDVSEWSRILRSRLELDEQIIDWVISGDIGVRKPDTGIYRELLRRLDVPAEQVVFVDDRVANLRAASDLGIKCVLYERGQDIANGGFYQSVKSMPALATLITSGILGE